MGARGVSDAAPKEIARGLYAKAEPERLDPRLVGEEVPLLILHHLDEPSPKSAGRLGVAEQRERHQLEGDQLMVGEDV